MVDDIKAIRKALLDQGWTIRPSRKHDVAYPPDESRSAVPLPSTPGGGRWKDNLIAQLHRSGFQWPLKRR